MFQPIYRAVLFTLAVSLPAAAQSSQVFITPESEPGWHPAPGMETQALTGMRAYFAALDSGHVDQAYAALDPSFQQMVNVGQLAQVQSASEVDTGVMTGVHVLRVTWTKPAPADPLSGVYAAVDVTKTFQRARRDCGYVVMRLAPGEGVWRVLRSEDHFVTDANYDSLVRQGRLAEAEKLWTLMKNQCPNMH